MSTKCAKKERGSYSLKCLDLRICKTGDETVESAESHNASYEIKVHLEMFQLPSECIKCYLPRWTFPFGMSPHVVPTANH